MNGSGEPVTVHILDREFHVACTPDERAGLLAAARYLDEKMREMRNGARTAGLDRIAILAALNICHELLDERARGSRESTQLAEKLQAINLKLERLLPASLQ
ncbi:cell division protein ZapA [Dokdonella fugitiva]|jgi:cell division protein ZapA|uniref:Cell division protein ZapA n=1 Tax=Dokdonella fugitiva TaxID=328517 RepID=A0A4R2IEB8_9GAMM|nr:cell division protein ZapA [Dokdonella fugitiva]MBA8882193.1 cell division protein ZapA [Dokdonella fugitiva]TCO43001.1 cell division protein ZapA [Dokdonella fugitiva]